MNISAKW